MYERTVVDIQLSEESFYKKAKYSSNATHPPENPNNAAFGVGLPASAQPT
jgi:hypothetical protein